MRICLVCRGYPTQRPGGMLFVCQDRAEALAAAGHEVFVLTTGTVHRDWSATSRSMDGRLTVMHLPCEPLKYTPTFGRLLAEQVERLRPQILHLDSFDRNCPWWESYSHGLRAVTMHGFGWGSLLTRWQMHLSGDRSQRGRITEEEFGDCVRERNALAAFDRRITISLHEEWLMGETYGLSSTLVYNPIPEQFFGPPADLPTGKRKFVAVAVSGHGPRGFAGLDALARKAGVEIEVVSGLAREQMPEVYDKSCGLVLPTRYCQGYDLAVAEALTRGREVIASDVGSYYAEARAGVPGLVTVRPDDEDGWIAELSRPSRHFTRSNRHRPQFHVERWLAALSP